MGFQQVKKHNQQDSQDSSSLQYLKDNEANDQQLQIGSHDKNELEADDSKILDSNNNSKMYREYNSRAREKDSFNQSSYRSRIVMNNRRKEKIVYSHPSTEGIFLYKPGAEFPALDEFINHPINVIVAAEYLNKNNPGLLNRNIYGSDVYTINSDCVAIGIHSGLFTLSTFTNNKYAGIQMVFRVLKSKKNYHGCFRNGIVSKPIADLTGNILKPESCKLLIQMYPLEMLEKYVNMSMPIGKTRKRQSPCNLNRIIPMPQSHLVFNCNFQPAYKYSLINISDKGFEKKDFLVRKLDSQVMYLETKKSERYQIFKTTENKFFQVYRISKLRHPIRHNNLYFEHNKAPLDSGLLDIIFEALEWQDLVWRKHSLSIKDQSIEEILSFKFYPRRQQP